MNIPFNSFVYKNPIVPYIREADYAIRTPWGGPTERKLLDYLLVYIQEGTCLFTVNKKKYVLEQGDFCLIQPNEVCSLKGSTNTITPYVHMDFFYHPLREQSFPTKSYQTDLSAFDHLMQPKLNDFHEIAVPVQFQPDHPVRFKDFMLKMIGLWLSGDVMSRIEAQNLGSELIYLILKKYGRFQQETLHSPDHFNWIMSYFSFHLSDNITVEDMAKRARMSPSSFSALFHKHFGTSPYQYLLKLRIENAQELLTKSNLKLHQIAEYCGFSDPHHFSKMFKKATGMTPGVFRNLYAPDEL